jgi:hypothetical protein
MGVFCDAHISCSFGHCVVCPSIYGFWLPLLVSSSSSPTSEKLDFISMQQDFCRDIVKYKINTTQPDIMDKVIPITHVANKCWTTILRVKGRDRYTSGNIFYSW